MDTLSKKDKARAQEWLDKVWTEEQSAGNVPRALADILKPYEQLLLAQLKAGRLAPPFNRRPPDGSLPRFDPEVLASLRAAKGGRQRRAGPRAHTRYNPKRQASSSGPAATRSSQLRVQVSPSPLHGCRIAFAHSSCCCAAQSSLEARTGSPRRQLAPLPPHRAASPSLSRSLSPRTMSPLAWPLSPSLVLSPNSTPLSKVLVAETAAWVVEHGDEFEAILASDHRSNPLYAFLLDPAAPGAGQPSVPYSPPRAPSNQTIGASAALWLT